MQTQTCTFRRAVPVRAIYRGLFYREKLANNVVIHVCARVLYAVRLPGWCCSGFGVPPPCQRAVGSTPYRDAFCGSDTRSRCQRFGFPRRFGLTAG